MDNNYLRDRLKYKGTVSQKEVDYISNLLPQTNKVELPEITGSVSDKELEYLRKRLPKGIK